MAYPIIEGDLCGVWWTHRRLLEEAASLLSSPTTEADICSVLQDIRNRAREMLRVQTTTTTTTTTNNNSNKVDTVVGVETLTQWNDELIVLRDRLLEALFREKQRQEHGEGDESFPENELAGGATTSTAGVPDSNTLWWEVHTMLISTVIGEWTSQWINSTNNDNNSGGGCPYSNIVVDRFLVNIAFTHASRWGGQDAVSLIGVVWSFVVDKLGMTPVEQEHNIPQLVRYTWDAFLFELQTVEEEVRQLCVGATERENEEKNGVDIVTKPDVDVVRNLVTRVVKVLRMLTTGMSSSLIASDTGMGERRHNCGHVVVSTSAKAKVLVQSLGRWLPLCGELLHSMIPQREGEARKQNAGNIGADNSGNNNNNNNINGNEEVESRDSKKLTTPEASEWIHSVRQSVQRVFMLLEAFNETSPWIIVLADTVARTFFLRPGQTVQYNPNKAEGDGTTDTDASIPVFKDGQHEALKLFLTWYSKRDDIPSSSSTAFSGATTRRTLVEACVAKMSHVVSSALDKTHPPSSLSIRVLRVLLVQRPIATLQHFLGILCPHNGVDAACDCEAAITDKGRASEARYRAFVEDPLEENAVALIFFPRYFTVFRTIEQAIVSLCNELVSQDTATIRTGGTSSPLVDTMERFIAAALDESFASFHSHTTATSEWLMFLAFLCSDTPLFDTHALLHTRQAARRFFAPGRLMLTHLHRHIVQLRRYALVAFFLPPLRAIGVDYSTAVNRDHVSCALRYPLSAEVAYFQELPRGYYARQSSRLALNAKNDALHFFHEALMSPSAVVTATREVSTGSTSHKEEDGIITRRLFIDIIAHAGVLVEARVRGDSDRRAVSEPLTIDVMSSMFFGVLRLCSSVTYWDAAIRHDVQRAIVKRLCAIRTSKASTVVKANTEEASHLPMAFLLRGGCTLEKKKAKDEDEDGVYNTAVEEYTEVPHAWRDWFCTAELDDIDPRAGTHAMTLLRVCNRAHTKYIPTRALLARRAALEQYALKEKELGLRARAIAVMETAIQHDVKMLRKQHHQGAEVTLPPSPPQEQTNPKEDIAVETNDANEEAKAAGTHTTPEDVNTSSKGDGQVLTSRDETPLPLAVVKPYIEGIVVTLMQRAHMSVVDGVTAGVGLKKWVEVVAHAFVPQAILETVRRVVLRANTKLTYSTKLECASLSAFLGIIADDIVLPYKQSFFIPRLVHAGQQQMQEQRGTTIPSETVGDKSSNNDSKSENSNNDSIEWPRRALPGSEKDAVLLLRLLIADATRAVVRFLAERTPLGDWRAYTVVFHLRHILGLVKRYESSFRSAVKERMQEMGIAPITTTTTIGNTTTNNTAANSTGAITNTCSISSVFSSGDGTHPVQLLASVECPLLPNMPAIARDVEHLFGGGSHSSEASLAKRNNNNNNNNNNTTTSAAMVQRDTSSQKKGGRHWVPQSGEDASRQKRHHSRDESYTQRHVRRKNVHRNDA